MSLDAAVGTLVERASERRNKEAMLGIWREGVTITCDTQSRLV